MSTHTFGSFIKKYIDMLFCGNQSKNARVLLQEYWSEFNTSKYFRWLVLFVFSGPNNSISKMILKGLMIIDKNYFIK